MLQMVLSLLLSGLAGFTLESENLIKSSINFDIVKVHSCVHPSGNEGVKLA